MKRLLALLLLLTYPFPAHAGLKAVSQAGTTALASGGTGATTGTQAISNLVTESTLLPNWVGALANVKGGTADAILCFPGDSITQGVLAGGYLNSTPTQFAIGLMKTYNIPAHSNAWFGDADPTVTSRRGSDSRLTMGGTWTSTGTNPTYGGNLFENTSDTSGRLTGQSDVATNTLKVFYKDTTGVFTISWSTTSGGTNLTTQTITGGGTNAVLSTTYTAGGTGQNFYNINRTSGTVDILGMYAYNSAKKQVIVINGGVTGWAASNWMDTTNAWSPGNMTASIGCNASIFMIGTNEENAGVSQSTFLANLQTFYNLAKSAARDFVFVTPIPSNPADGVHNILAATQLAFSNAIVAKATANAAPSINMYQRWQSYAVSSIAPRSYYADTWTHPNAAGDADTAGAEQRILMGQMDGANSNQTSLLLNPDTWGTNSYKVNGSSFMGCNAGGCTSTYLGITGFTTSIAGTNVAIGNLALNVSTNGSNNTAVGYNAMAALTGAGAQQGNTGIGQGALSAMNANFNTAVGNNAGSSITSGANNTVLGKAVASSTLTTGSNNILIGVDSTTTTAAAATSNTLKIGGLSPGVATISTTGTNTAAPFTTMGGPVQIAGTKFTTSGCSVSATAGGAAGGTFTLGANTCTAVVTPSGATGATATTGWTCYATDQTAPTILIGGNSSSTTTTASFTIPAGAGATDVIGFHCDPY